MPTLQLAKTRIAKSARIAYYTCQNYSQQHDLRLRTVERMQFMSHSEFNHLLASINSLSPEQLRQLRQQLDSQLARPTQPLAQARAKRTKAAPAPRRKPLTEAEFNQHLLSIGLITSLPDPTVDIDDDDPEDAPVTIKGEPLSATIIRERR